MKKDNKVYNAKMEQPKKNEVVLVELNNGAYCLAYFDIDAMKWYRVETSASLCNKILCKETVVAWMYLPEPTNGDFKEEGFLFKNPIVEKIFIVLFIVLGFLPLTLCILGTF